MNVGECVDKWTDQRDQFSLIDFNTDSINY